MLSIRSLLDKTHSPGSGDWIRGLPLRLEGVRVARGSTEILRGIDLEFFPGHNYVLIGHSGSGKSTLMRLLNRLEDPSQGSMYLGENPLDQVSIESVRRNVGLVFQAPRLLPGNIAENLQFRRTLSRLPPLAVSQMTQTLSDLGLASAGLGRDASTFSGGERQRLAIAMALDAGPEILAMDEPTSALDPRALRQVLEFLARRNADVPLRTISICHHRGHAALLGDQAVVLDRGLIVDQGPIQEVLSRTDSGIWDHSA